MTDLVLPRPFSPLRLETRSLGWQAAAVVIGTLLLALSSQIKVPMVPVPMTMQTFAVTLLGALYGWRLGAVTVIAWLLEGAAGLPVFAGAFSGVAYLAGPTGGYLLAFPFAAALTGFLAQRGWNGGKLGLATLSMLAGNALCIVLGTAWLATFIGAEKAIAAGATPFILGAILKSALAAAALKAFAPRG